MSELPRFEPRPDPRPGDTTVWPALAWPPPADLVLQGSTVELAAIDLARDASELFAAIDLPQVWAHLPIDPGNVSEFVADMQGRIDKGFFYFTVRLLRDVNDARAGQLVGMTSYLDVQPSDARLEIGGTAYAPSVWASDVNPESKLLLFTHAFDVLQAGRVQIKTDIRNVRSQQAIARLGATYEGVWRRNQRRSDGTMRDSVMFSVIAEEWPTVRDRLAQRLTH